MFTDSNLLTSKIPQFCTVGKYIYLFALILTAVRQIKQIMDVSRLIVLEITCSNFIFLFHNQSVGKAIEMNTIIHYYLNH